MDEVGAMATASDQGRSLKDNDHDTRQVEWTKHAPYLCSVCNEALSMTDCCVIAKDGTWIHPMCEGKQHKVSNGEEINKLDIVNCCECGHELRIETAISEDHGQSGLSWYHPACYSVYLHKQDPRSEM
jgi:hypothetical protein